MPKTQISEYDTVAANNTDVDSISTAEGMAPSDVNNAIREIMAHLKDFYGDIRTGATFAGASVDFDTDISVDTINESTAAAGVTIDGVLLKDNAVNVDTITEKTTNAGVTIEGALLKDDVLTLSKDIDDTTGVLNVEESGAVGTRCAVFNQSGASGGITNIIDIQKQGNVALMLGWGGSGAAPDGSIQSFNGISYTVAADNDHIFGATSGVGNVVCGTSALATNETDGFLYVPTMAGAPSGTPSAKTGTAALVFDTTNNDLYVYDGSWLSVSLT